MVDIANQYERFPVVSAQLILLALFSSRLYNQQHGSRFTSVIPTNIFGEHDNFSLENGHVIPSLIHQCFLAKRHNDSQGGKVKGSSDTKAFIIRGSGAPLRQFIYSKDLAKLLVWTLRKYEDVQPIILSVNEEDEVSIKEVAFMIAKHMDFQGEIKVDSF